ncbi:MAG: MFS transporter [Acidobacteria bacterium]|nr:MFS transporter [Acidobacteriota bacterium]
MPLIAPRRAALVVTSLAFFVDTLLYALLVPLLPRYAAEMGLGPLGVGALFGSYAVALLLATFPVARLTDRWGRRMPMLLGLAGLAFTTAVFAWSRSFPLLLAARSLQGVAGAATWLPGMALVADHWPSEERGRALGIAFAGANLGMLLGPPLSGFLDQHFGPSAPFQLGIGLVALDALGRVFLLQDAEPVKAPPIPWRALLENRVIRIFAGAAVVASGTWALLEAVLPLDMAGRLRLGSRAIGFLFAGMALSHALSSPWMGRLSDRVGRTRVLRLGLGSAALLMPLPALVPTPWTLAAALVALGVNASFLISPCSPAVADEVERMGSQSFASGFGVLNLAYSLGMVVGPFLGGALVQALGAPWALATVGLLCGAGLAATRGLTV